MADLAAHISEKQGNVGILVFPTVQGKCLPWKLVYYSGPDGLNILLHVQVCILNLFHVQVCIFFQYCSNFVHKFHGDALFSDTSLFMFSPDNAQTC